MTFKSLIDITKNYIPVRIILSILKFTNYSVWYPTENEYRCFQCHLMLKLSFVYWLNTKLHFELVGCIFPYICLLLIRNSITSFLCWLNIPLYFALVVKFSTTCIYWLNTSLYLVFLGWNVITSSSKST